MVYSLTTKRDLLVTFLHHPSYCTTATNLGSMLAYIGGAVVLLAAAWVMRGLLIHKVEVMIQTLSGALFLLRARPRGTNRMLLRRCSSPC